MPTFFIGLMGTPLAIREHGKPRRCNDPLTHFAAGFAPLGLVDIGKGNEGVERTAVTASVGIEGH